jgi:hypothetical protein
MFGHGGNGGGLLAGVIGYHISKKMKHSAAEHGPALTARRPPARSTRERPASEVIFPTPVAGPMRSVRKSTDPAPPPPMAYPEPAGPLDPRYQPEPSASEGPSDADGPFAPPAQDWRPPAAPTPFKGACRPQRAGSLSSVDPYGAARARPPP